VSFLSIPFARKSEIMQTWFIVDILLVVLAILRAFSLPSFSLVEEG